MKIIIICHKDISRRVERVEWKNRILETGLFSETSVKYETREISYYNMIKG